MNVLYMYCTYLYFGSKYLLFLTWSKMKKTFSLYADTYFTTKLITIRYKLKKVLVLTFRFTYYSYINIQYNIVLRYYIIPLLYRVITKNIKLTFGWINLSRYYIINKYMYIVTHKNIFNVHVYFLWLKPLSLLFPTTTASKTTEVGAVGYTVCNGFWVFAAVTVENTTPTARKSVIFYKILYTIGKLYIYS